MTVGISLLILGYKNIRKTHSEYVDVTLAFGIRSWFYFTYQLSTSIYKDSAAYRLNIRFKIVFVSNEPMRKPESNFSEKFKREKIQFLRNLESKICHSKTDTYVQANTLLSIQIYMEYTNIIYT